MTVRPDTGFQSRMKIMFSILGEGRGHLTQAIAVKDMVEKAGHQVSNVVLGMGANRQVPAFFSSVMKMPITRIPTLDFSYNVERQTLAIQTRDPFNRP